MVVRDIKRIRNDKHQKSKRWTPTLRQLLKTLFEKSNSTNLLEKELVFYRKALNDLSKTPAGAVSE